MKGKTEKPKTPVKRPLILIKTGYRGPARVKLIKIMSVLDLPE